MRNNKCSPFLVAIAIMSTATTCYCYSETTHAIVNESIVNLGLVDLSDLLMKELGYKLGYKTVINGKSVKEWIKEGGVLEDDPDSRGANHYLDPTGHDSYNMSINTRRLNSVWASGYSVLYGTNYPADNWALDLYGAQWISTCGENRSWPDAMKYWRIGVSGRDESGVEVAANRATREVYLALAFQSLGQVMHLVEDMSVPGHTRNDAHPGGVYLDNEPYEDWCKEHGGTIQAILGSSSILLPDSPSYVSFLADQGCAPIAHIPHASVRPLFDNPALEGQNCLGEGIPGLAEYTNCNMASKDTIRDSSFSYGGYVPYKYPYPKFEHLTYERSPRARVNEYSFRTLLDTYPIKIDPYIAKMDPALNFPSYYEFTDACLSAHAWVLVPKAASYASRVMQLFFDKDMEVFEFGKKVRVYSRSYRERKSDPPVRRALIAEYDSPGLLYAEDEDGKLIRNHDTCENRYLYIMDQGEDQPVLAALVPADIGLDPSPGSLTDGFAVRLVKPDPADRCPEEPAVDADGSPLAVDLSGEGSTFRVYGIPSDGSEEILLQEGTNNWPSYQGAYSSPFKHYRVEASGLAGGIKFRSETFLNQWVEDFEYTVCGPTSCDLGLGSSIDFVNSLPDAPVPQVTVGVLSYDEVSENCDYYNESGKEDGNCYGGGTMTWWSPDGFHGNGRTFTSDSVFRLNVTGSTLPATGTFDLRIELVNPATSEQKILFTSQIFHALSELDGKTFGELFNGQIQTFDGFLTKIIIRFPSCCVGADHVFFQIQDFEIIP